MPRFARNDGCEVTGLPRFPSVARNDEKRGKVLLRHRTRAKSKKLSLISSSPMREEEIITFSVFLAEEECGLPRFARNDGCEVTGLPRFPSVARNDEGRGKARLRVGTRAKSKKLLLTSSSPIREQEIIIFSVLLAEEECGLPRFPSVARNDERRGKARLRAGTSMRFLSGGRKEVGTRVRFLSRGRQEVGTRVRFLSGGWKEVGTGVRFLSGRRQEVGTSMRFLSGGRQEVGTRGRFLSGGRQGVGTWVKSKKLSLTSSLPMREQEIIIFSVFLAGEECGLPRFARNDGRRGLDCHASLAMTGGGMWIATLRSQWRV